MIVLRGRKVVGGRAEGEALVTHMTVPGWGGVNPIKGVITEPRHDLRGVRFAGKVLVFRGAKGSSGWSAMYHTTRLAGTAPAALVFNEMTTKVAALDSAKQAHYLPAIMGVQAWFGTTRDCIEAAITGRWNGACPS